VIEFLKKIAISIFPQVMPLILIRRLNDECSSIVVKALGYKPEGRGLETRRGEILNLRNPSGRSRPWGLPTL
jgi:hypothetical protein